MSRKRFRQLGWFALLEVVAAVHAFATGHGRIQDIVAWVTAWQLAIGMFIFLFVLMMKHKDKYYTNHASLSRGGTVRVSMATLGIIIIIVSWAIGVFPGLVRLSLQHYGIDDVAIIENYELIEYGSAGGESTVNTLVRANAINVELSYDNRTATISIPKDHASFNELYVAARTGERVPVRYVRWAPVIVLPKAELD